MGKNIPYLVLFILVIFPSFQIEASGSRTGRPLTGLPSARFIMNKAQWDPRVIFKCDLPMGSLFLEQDCFTYLLIDPAALNACPESGPRNVLLSAEVIEDHLVNCHSYKVNIIGSKKNTPILGEQKHTEYYNYFLGNDPSRWASFVPVYDQVRYPSLYPGIDLVVGSKEMNLKVEFQLAEGSDPALIDLYYQGADEVLVSSGQLIVRTSVNNVIEQKPFAYQVISGDTLVVPCQYQLKRNHVHFVFPEGYRTDLPLVIDPVVVASTYAGSTGTGTWGNTATYDMDGNIYTGGRSLSAGYPTTTGAFQMNFGGGSNDAAISKFNPDGSAMLWSTYLGGSGDDFAHSLIVNNNNELFVLGSTTSGNYPVTMNCFQSVYGGNGDIIVTHLSATGGALIGSTYIGGSGNDGQNNQMSFNYGDNWRGEVILDDQGNPCIASFSCSDNFPTTPGAFDQTLNGGQDGVILKLNSNLTQLIWSSYLGGSGNDCAFGLKLNSVGMVYVAGGTQSADFPTTQYVLHPSYLGGSHDAFVCIFMPDMSQMIAGTFFGTSLMDIAFFIEMDYENNVYIYGQSEGIIPVTPGCWGVPGSRQFIVKLDQTLNGVIFSTVFGDGNTGLISPTAFLVDLCKNVYAAGWGQTTGFPVSANAVQPTTDGKDFYLIALKNDAAQLFYATFYGAQDPTAYGDHVDGGTSRFDKRGVVYEAVCACHSTNPFPTTPNAWQPDPPVYPPQYCDLAVFKIDFQLSGPHAEIGVLPSNTGCLPYDVNFTNASVNAVQYIWDFGDGSPAEFSQLPSHTFIAAGTYTVSCIAIDSASCFITDTAYQTIQVLSAPVVNLGNDTLMCGLDTLLLNAGNPGSSYLWSNNAASQQIKVTNAGNWWVQVSNGVCTGSDTLHAEFMDPPDLGPDISVCQGDTVILNTNMPGYLYQWSNGAQTAYLSVTNSGIYWVDVSRQYCTLRDSVVVNFTIQPLVNLGPDRQLCHGQSVLLDAGNPGCLYSWNTGEWSQQISASATGDYSVIVTKNGCSGQDTVHVEVTPLPSVNLGDNRVICEFETITLDAGSAGGTYQWNTGDNTQQITVSDSGTYSVTVTKAGCSSGDTVNVNKVVLKVSLGNDTLLCPGHSLVLDAGNPGSNYLWNTGAIHQAIVIMNNGYYWVKVSRYQCYDSDTIHVDLMQSMNLPELLNLCEKESVLIRAGIEADSFLWSDGTESPDLTVYEAGMYTLEARKKQCILQDSTRVIGKPGISTLYLPNSFSPNGDGVNDFFSAIGTDITYFNMLIFNRWGELIFETYDPATGWDGRYQGSIVMPGVYYYVISYANSCSFEQKFKREGTVQVVR